MELVDQPDHGFAATEFETRLTRAQALMTDHTLDALVVTAPPNFRYFSGFETQFWESPTRPWFLVVPRVGEPIAVVPEIGAPQIAETWVSDIRTWPAPRPKDDGISLLAGVLEALPRMSGRIGMELGREHSLRMPVVELEALRARLSGVEIVNGSPCLWAIRMVKTAAEIARISHICRIASATYAAVPTLISIGDTERDAARKVAMDLLARGADTVPFLPAISGPGGVSQIVCGPRDRVITNGDILFFDTGATFDGYYCDFDRNYAVGTVDDATHRAHDAVWRATEAGIAAATPGATTDKLHKAMSVVLEDAGSRGNNVGRLGHGLGMQLTEPPSHMPGDGTILQPGMVITIEPGMEYAPARMIVHEENILITGDGPVLLTERAPRDLPVIR